LFEHDLFGKAVSKLEAAIAAKIKAMPHLAEILAARGARLEST
jgi:hypothetical protein